MALTERIEFRGSSDELGIWKTCAESMRVSLSQWIRMMLNSKVKRGGTRAWTPEEWKKIEAGNVPVYTSDGRFYAWERTEKLRGDRIGFVMGGDIDE